MKIISKFGDYYDGVSPGDQSPLYLRHSVLATAHGPGEDEVKYGSYLAKGRPPMPNLAGPYRVVSVWFCGKLYVWAEDEDGKHHLPKDWPAMELRYRKQRKDLHSLTVRGEREYKKRLRQLAEEWEAKMAEPVPDKVFVSHNAPVILAESVRSPSIRFRRMREDARRIYVNPCLKDFSFAKHVDPYQAYQELDMFLGSVLADNAPPPLEISDEDRMAMKGFDKTSFRASPGYKPNRKARRKQRREK